MYESSKVNGVLQELNISTTRLIARIYQRQEGYVKFGELINNRLLEVDSESKIMDVLAMFELVEYDALSKVRWLKGELEITKDALVEASKIMNINNR